MGHLQPETANTVIDRFLRDAPFYLVFDTTANEFREATRLLLSGNTGLRGPDALHLAVAKRHGATLYTLDRTLRRAAVTLGVPASDAGIGAP